MSTFTKARFAEIFDAVMALFYGFPGFNIYFVGRPLNMISALGCGLLRAMSGEFAAKGIGQCKRPATPLKLYEFEACPFCRKVREALCVLDLDADIMPCPKPALFGQYGAANSNSRFRAEVADPSGDTRFPVLVDGAQTIRGSEAIIDHLWQQYGDKAEAPWNYRLGRRLDAIKLAFMLPSLLRLRTCHGILKAPSRKPERPLELWGYEPSPFVKIVRETLCCLELPYRAVNVPHGRTEKRQQFIEKYGNKMSQGGARKAVGAIQVPMLIDPNNKDLKGEPIFESAVIVDYLHKTYGLDATTQKLQ